MIVTVTVTPVIFTALGDAALASEAGYLGSQQSVRRSAGSSVRISYL